MRSFFTIVTPTVMRPSLAQACSSIDEQSFLSWQHLVMIDSTDIDDELMFSLAHPKRQFIQCDKPHRNTGNTCRHNAWDHASGTWHIFLDDDNFLNGPRVLEEIAEVLRGQERAIQWALFPIQRHGSRFYFDPPEPCYFDTGNAVVHNDFAQWPDIPDYASDAVWLQQFKSLPYLAFPNFQPIMVMPGTSFGAGGGMHGQ